METQDEIRRQPVEIMALEESHQESEKKVTGIKRTLAMGLVLRWMYGMCRDSIVKVMKCQTVSTLLFSERQFRDRNVGLRSLLSEASDVLRKNSKKQTSACKLSLASLCRCTFCNLTRVFLTLKSRQRHVEL